MLIFILLFIGIFSVYYVINVCHIDVMVSNNFSEFMICHYIMFYNLCKLHYYDCVVICTDAQRTSVSSHFCGQTSSEMHVISRNGFQGKFISLVPGLSMHKYISVVYINIISISI